MGRCTHNDVCPELQPCKNEGIGEHGYCVEHGCCLCGGVMLADTEDWRVYLCAECYFTVVGDLEHRSRRAVNMVEKLIEAAYEAGRRSVIGGVLEPDEDVENAR